MNIWRPSIERRAPAPIQAATGGVLKVTILSPRRVLFDGEAASVFLPGDQAEFELLDFHAPIVSLLHPGHVIIDWQRKVDIKRGMVKFDNNECMVLVED